MITEDIVPCRFSSWNYCFPQSQTPTYLVGSNTTVTQYPSKVNIGPVNWAPVIPHRSGPSRKDTSPTKEMAREKYHDQPKNTESLAILSSRRDVVSLNPLLESDQMKSWAEMVIENMETPRQGQTKKEPRTLINSNQRKPAFTPTTITTGYVPNLPSLVPSMLSADVLDGTVEESEGARVTRGSTAHEMGSGERQPDERKSDYDLLASPPRLRQSVWPSLALHETSPTRFLPARAHHSPSLGRTRQPVDKGTTSCRQLSPMKVRSKQLARREAAESGRVKDARRRTSYATTNHGHGKDHARTFTSRSTSKLDVQPDTSIGSAAVDMSESSPEMAQEAAKVALVLYGATSAKMVTVRRTRERAGCLDRVNSEGPGGEGGIVGRSSGQLRTADDVFASGTRNTLGRQTWTRNTVRLACRLAVAYWRVVRPVFDSTSQMRVRFTASRSTWHDCGVCVLALVFILSAVLVGIWMLRVTMLVAAISKMVVRGLVMLSGL
jgi:hypothetical protein